MSERNKPLHVRVAEALGWADCYQKQDSSVWLGFAPKHGARNPPWSVWMEVPRYDTDWSATGPLIEKHKIVLMSHQSALDEWGQPPGPWGEHGNAAPWYAYCDEIGRGDAPLVAVCNLILVLKEAGRLG